MLTSLRVNLILSTLWPLDAKSCLIGKNPSDWKDSGQAEKGATEEIVGWNHWLNGHEFEKIPGDSEGQGSLASCSSVQFSSVQFSSVAQSCPTLCNPMDCSTLGLPVHHQLLSLIQTHVYWVGDAIQPSYQLQFMRSQKVRHNLVTEQQNHLIWYSNCSRLPNSRSEELISVSLWLAPIHLWAHLFIVTEATFYTALTPILESRIFMKISASSSRRIIEVKILAVGILNATTLLFSTDLFNGQN